MPKHRSKGFTLVELIAVLVLVAVISSVAITSLIPSASLQLQSSRDILVAAFFSAQQKAMVQTKAVQLITTSSSVDLRMDVNNDGNFSVDESVSIGGINYPVNLVNGQTLTSAVFNFDRLGRTSAATLVLSQSGSSVSINVSSNGAVY